MILQMFGNAEFFITNKALVWAVSIMNIHMILEFNLGEELHGTDFTVKQHNRSTLLSSVLLNVNLVALCFCECLEAVVAAMKGSACFHRLNC